MIQQPMIHLSNDVSIPQLGLGVYKVPQEEVYDTVRSALELGYRHIDTASYYDNEEGVGQAIKDSGIPRDDIFITTKVWNNEQGYENALEAYDRSLNKLQIEAADLYLIHWPVPNIFPETWKALEQLYTAGKVREIGVSNFLVHHLQKLLQSAEIKPVANQIELHPKLMQKRTVDFCRKNDITIQSWSPLGRAHYLDDQLLVDIAKKHTKTTAQIMIRWHLQHGFVVIPKSTKPKRQKENISVFDFELSKDEMKLIDGLEEGLRIGSHPDHITR